MVFRTSWESRQSLIRILHRNIYIALLLRLLVVLMIFTLCRVFFYWYNIDLFPEMTFSRFFRILIGGIRFDVAGILYLNALVVLLVILPIRVKFSSWYQRLVSILYLLFNGLGILVNLADMVYYRTTLRRTTLSVLDQFKHEDNLLALSFRFLIDYWVATVLFLCLIFILYWLYRKIKVEGPKFSEGKTFYGGGVFAGLILSGLFIGGIRGDFRKSTRPITISNAAAYAEIPEDVYLVVNTPFTLIRTSTIGVIKKVSYFKSENDLNNEFDPIHRPAVDSAFKNLNVVIIILESFSMEFSGFYNRNILVSNYKGYTPFMDSLASKGIAFQYSFANGRKSIDAMPSVLSSIPSIKVPFVLSHYSNNRINSIASLLKVKGYHSAFFHGAPNGSMGFDAFARQGGFDSYYGKNEFDLPVVTDGIWGIWDHDFFPFFARKIDDLPQPFCATLFSLSSHHPFELPESHKDKYNEKGPNKMYPMVRYTDDALRSLFHRLSKKPWFNNTLFVITADHVSSEVTQPQYKTPWGQYAVPIIFYWYGMEPRFYEQQVAQQIDIMPSLLSILNYDLPYLAFGKNLFGKNKNDSFNYSGTTYQLMQDSLLLRFDGSRSLGLYDFKNDPLMKQNVADKYSLTRLENRIKAYIQQYNNRMVENRLIIGR